jgi:phospholipid/cholesterol/gamma-HCH transport system permease protein
MDSISEKQPKVACQSVIGVGNLGQAVILFAATLRSLPQLSWPDFIEQCKEIAFGSITLIVLAALFVGAALSLQTVVELQNFEAQDYAGSVISIGLLRELGPLTVGLAWAGWLTAKIMADMESVSSTFPVASKQIFARQFIAPRYLAALSMALPLATFGLAVGFLVGALTAASVGVTTTNTFFGAARMVIHNKDLAAYFLKLVLINPTIAVFTACAYGFNNHTPGKATADALMAAFITTFIANFLLTAAMFAP